MLQGGWDLSLGTSGRLGQAEMPHLSPGAQLLTHVLTRLGEVWGVKGAAFPL